MPVLQVPAPSDEIEPLTPLWSDHREAHHRGHLSYYLRTVTHGMA